MAGRREPFQVAPGVGQLGGLAAGEEPAEVEGDRVGVPDVTLVERLDGLDQLGQLGLAVALRQVGEGFPADLLADPLAEEQLEVDLARPLHPQELLDAQPAQEEPGAGLAGDGDRPAVGYRPAPVGLERLHRLAAGIVEILVGRVVGRDQGDLDGLGDREEARGPDGLEPDQRSGVGRQLLESVEGTGDAVPPGAQDAGGGGPGVEVGRGQHPVEQLDVDDVLVLMGPEGFGQAMLVIGIVSIQPGDPGLEGGDDLRGIPRAQLGPGPVADPVLGMLEEPEQFLDRVRRRSGGRRECAAVVGDPVHPAVDPVAAGIPQVVLHVADDRVLPVEEIDGPVRPNLDVGRPEIRVAG